MQGIIKAYDPGSGDGVVISDKDLSEYNLAPNALEGSIFRMLRQGQRVVFALDSEGRLRVRHGHPRLLTGSPKVLAAAPQGLSFSH